MSAAQRARNGEVSASEQQAIDQAIEAGAALHRRGLIDDAERLYAGILKLAPKHFDAMHLLGVVHQQRGDSDGALRLIGAALELNDASADAHSNHGKVLLQLRRFDEALVSVERALALVPDHPQALINRATIGIEQRQFADALTDVLRVLEKNPESVDAWTKHGNVLVATGEGKKAIASYDKALAIRPNHAEALNNRGCQLGELGCAKEALADYDHVLEVNPRHLEAWINRGHMLVELHREEEAIASYRQAHMIAPHHPDAMYNEGLNQLRLGDFKCGWENYELRWFVKDFAHTERRYPLPRWNGEAVDGTLLISGEQGLGDQILFSSMLPDVIARTPQVTVEVEPRLIPLFARSFPGTTFVPRETQELYTGPAAAQIHMGSLGKHLRPDWQSFPARENGYLRCNSELSARLRERLDDGRKVIGLSWGSNNPRYGASKSALLHDLAALLRLPGCRFIDLQYGDTRTAREAVRHDLGVTVERLPDVDNYGDIDALASLIAACDIVVTVSNTTAHLAGALGKDTYLLVPSGRGRMWCWFRDRDNNPIYLRMRLQRQKPRQPWTDLVGAIAADIAAR
jgi:tetratricopeptide (TPR) repeat protein/ADP-heptose:LPS heptosyltransferase